MAVPTESPTLLKVVHIQPGVAGIQHGQTHCLGTFLSAILAGEHDQVAARGAEETTSFLLVLTDTSVVTGSSAAGARISLNTGLDAPNPDDLISLPPVLF